MSWKASAFFVPTISAKSSKLMDPSCTPAISVSIPSATLSPLLEYFCAALVMAFMAVSSSIPALLNRPINVMDSPTPRPIARSAAPFFSRLLCRSLVLMPVSCAVLVSRPRYPSRLSVDSPNCFMILSALSTAPTTSSPFISANCANNSVVDSSCSPVKPNRVLTSPSDDASVSMPMELLAYTV